MLAVSAGFLQAIKNKAPQDVRLEFANGDVINTSDISITSGGLTYTAILNGETDVIFGRAVMSELSAVLINADGQFTDFDFSREFTAKVGVKVGSTFEYVSLGVFKGNRPDKVRGKLIDFTAHDRMSLFDRPAESFADGLTFPCTLGQIFTKLCDFCGVGYDSASFPNSGKTFDKNPLEDTDYTCREILGYISEAAGSYARISRDGAVELVWFADADYTVTRTDRFEMTESEFLTPPIDRLEVYNSYGDQLNSSGSGDIVYGISDNPFLHIENDTQLEGLQPYVDAIYNRITSLPAYHPSSFRAEFNPAVQCGDVISVVDDYGETIRFPVFVQTITWNGFGKATYENTGGVIRQNAPFTQRELEQVKKKSVKTKDLWAYINSYINSEEGKAVIESVVGGEWVTQDDLNGYAKTTYVNTKITQEVANGIGKLTLSATEDSTVTTIDEDVGEEYTGDYTVDINTTFYTFTSRDSEGYYTSRNAGVNESVSYIRLDFNFSVATEVTFRCICRGESSWDYGLISLVDTDLMPSYTPDDKTQDDEIIIVKTWYYSFKNQHSKTPVDVKMTIPAGSHYVTVKYCKDTSNHAVGDYFKFRVFTTKTETTSAKSTITLYAGEGEDKVEISSADITFKGFVTFESLSTPNTTTIDGSNISTENLYVQKVYYKSDDGYFQVLSSEIASSGTKPNTFTYVGPKDLGGRDTDLDGYMQSLELYGSPIYFGRPGYEARQDNRALRVDVWDRAIKPASDRGVWSIGTKNYPFKDAFFVDGLYLYDDGGGVGNRGWAQLYTNGHELYWENAMGTLYRVRLSVVD